MSHVKRVLIYWLFIQIQSKKNKKNKQKPKILNKLFGLWCDSGWVPDASFIHMTFSPLRCASNLFFFHHQKLRFIAWVNTQKCIYCINIFFPDDDNLFDRSWHFFLFCSYLFFDGTCRDTGDGKICDEPNTKKKRRRRRRSRNILLFWLLNALEVFKIELWVNERLWCGRLAVRFRLMNAIFSFDITKKNKTQNKMAAIFQHVKMSFRIIRFN